MKFSFSVKDFVTALSNVCSVVAAKNSMPILDTVCVSVVDASEMGCLLMASDGEMWLSVRTGLLKGDVGLRFCVNAVDFLKILRNLGDVDVDCDVDLSKSTLKCVYDTGYFTLPCLPAVEYPQPPVLSNDVIGDIQLVAGDFNRCINAVRFCVADETLRPTLNGVNVSFSDTGITTAATDGNRLARYYDANIVSGRDFSFILPRKAVAALSSLAPDKEIHLRIDGRTIDVECYSFGMTARLIEGRYPNYNSVIPSTHEISVVLDKSTVLTALKRVVPLGNTTSQLVTFAFSREGLEIEAKDIDFNKSGQESVFCEYDADDIVIGFKGSALIDVFTNIVGDKVNMEITDASHACVFHGGNRDEYLAVLMPMLID